MINIIWLTIVIHHVILVHWLSTLRIVGIISTAWAAAAGKGVLHIIHVDHHAVISITGGVLGIILAVDLAVKTSAGLLHEDFLGHGPLAVDPLAHEVVLVLVLHDEVGGAFLDENDEAEASGLAGGLVVHDDALLDLAELFEVVPHVVLPEGGVQSAHEDLLVDEEAGVAGLLLRQRQFSGNGADVVLGDGDLALHLLAVDVVRLVLQDVVHLAAVTHRNESESTRPI